MQTKHFSIHINAPRNVVWHALWNDTFYREWTAIFHEGSHYVGELIEGGEILFVDPEGSGLYSNIESMDEPVSIVFRHQGELKNREKQPPGSWANSKEAYTLTEEDGGTLLSTELESVEEMVEFFAETFPKALALIKEIAESERGRTVTIETTVNASIEAVWKAWNTPEDIVQWNNAMEQCKRRLAHHQIRS